MPNFNVLNLGDVYKSGEAIKGAQQTNALNAKKNELENTKMLYLGASQVADDPSMASTVIPKLQELGIMNMGNQWEASTLEAIQAGAVKIRDSVGKALQGMNALDTTPVNNKGKFNPGDYTVDSWAEANKTGTFDQTKLVRYQDPYRPVVKTINGVTTVIQPGQTGHPTNPITTTNPLSTLDEEVKAATKLSEGTAQGKANVDLVTQPKIAEDKEEAVQKTRLLWTPKITRAVAEAQTLAKSKGESLTALAQAEAAMPGLLEAVGELKTLAKSATSTIGGRAWDMLVKETGFGSTTGATAQAKFIAIVNNQVLPLLKPTFGAAFTVQEGESLKRTMGDPNASPEQKIAQLEAFINQKFRDIQTKKNEVKEFEQEQEKTVNWADL